MEDFLGIIVFLLFVGGSLLGRINQSRQRRAAAEEEQRTGVPRTPRPTYPGPVAQPLDWPPAAEPEDEDQDEEWRVGPSRPEPQRQEPARQGEGTSGMNVRRRVANLDGTRHQTAEDRLRDSRLGTLRREEEIEAMAPEPTVNLALAEPDAMARAVVMAEVLGRPKALRRRR